MITMTVGLEATNALWARDRSERTIDSIDFVSSNHVGYLAPAT
jgi:hypothetical protein